MQQVIKIILIGILYCLPNIMKAQDTVIVYIESPLMLKYRKINEKIDSLLGYFKAYKSIAYMHDFKGLYDSEKHACMNQKIDSSMVNIEYQHILSKDQLDDLSTIFLLGKKFVGMETNHCVFPRYVIVFYNEKDIIIAYILVSTICGNLTFSDKNQELFLEMNNLQQQKMKIFLKKLGYPIFNHSLREYKNYYDSLMNKK